MVQSKYFVHRDTTSVVVRLEPFLGVLCLLFHSGDPVVSLSSGHGAHTTGVSGSFYNTKEKRLEPLSSPLTNQEGLHVSNASEYLCSFNGL